MAKMNDIHGWCFQRSVFVMNQILWRQQDFGPSKLNRFQTGDVCVFLPHLLRHLIHQRRVSSSFMVLKFKGEKRDKDVGKGICYRNGRILLIYFAFGEEARLRFCS